MVYYRLEKAEERIINRKIELKKTIQSATERDKKMGNMKESLRDIGEVEKSSNK